MGSQTAPEIEVLIPIDQALKHLGLNGTAYAVGRENRIQYVSVSAGSFDVILQSLGIPPRLLLIGGNPEIGLDQKENEYDWNPCQNTTHFSVSLHGVSNENYT